MMFTYSNLHSQYLSTLTRFRQDVLQHVVDYQDNIKCISFSYLGMIHHKLTTKDNLKKINMAPDPIKLICHLCKIA